MTNTQPERRRFFRYSLRTMMIVVTVFCIWLGIATKRARDQRVAVKAILEVGGIVVYEHEKLGSKIEPPGPKWLRQIMGDEYFFSVYSLYFIKPRTSETSLAEITKLAEAKQLYVFNTKVSDIELEHLKGATKLRSLRLMDTQNTFQEMKKFQEALPNCSIFYRGEGGRKWSLPVWRSTID